MFHPKQETGRDSGGSDYFQVGHRNSWKRHLSCTAAESLSLSLPVVMVVCEHSRRSKGFWQETGGAVKKAYYSQSLSLYLLYGNLQLISGTVYCSQVRVCRKTGSQPAAHIRDTNYETSGERKKERVYIFLCNFGYASVRKKWLFTYLNAWLLYKAGYWK